MIREQGNWHFLFKFKSNSRNNRRDKCDVLAELCTGQDHCHSWGAPHGHVGLIFINISRQAGRPRVCECPSCQQLSSRKSESWYNLIQFTNPRTSRYSKFTTLLYYGPRMNVNINNLHWMRLERMLGVWVRVVSRQWMLTPKSQASTISHPIFSFSGNKVLRLQSSKGIIFIVNDICFVFGGTIRRRIALDYNCNLISE